MYFLRFYIHLLLHTISNLILYSKMKKWSGKDLKKMKKVKDLGKKHHKSGKVGWKKKHLGKSKKEHESHEQGSKKKKKSESKKI